jgi:hypothetical protein
LQNIGIIRIAVTHIQLPKGLESFLQRKVKTIENHLKIFKVLSARGVMPLRTSRLLFEVDHLSPELFLFLDTELVLIGTYEFWL